MHLEAITFDFWNTLMYEPPGALVEARLPVLGAALAAFAGPVDERALAAAHDVAFHAYQEAWKANRQYRVPDAVDSMLGHLGIEATPVLRDALASAFDEGGRRADIRLVGGVAELLATLRSHGVRLGIICDIGLTPSPVLRERLADHALLDAFDAWVFSDEFGCYKPSPSCFREALAGLEAGPEQAAHVGDRTRTDVAGALSTGMTAVRFTGVYDDPDPGPSAHFVVDSYEMLPTLLGLA